MEILLVWSTATICMLAFYFGLIAGKGEQIGDKEVEIPSPMKAYKNHKERQEIEKKQEKMDIIMQNINNYDGTSNGQQDVPN